MTIKDVDRVVKLLDPTPEELSTEHGYLDLLGEAEQHDTIAQRFMRSGLVPRIYEDLWRPVLFGLSKGGPLGPSTAEEYALAVRRLRLAEAPGGTVLDVACGPGNVTRALATGLGAQGLIVGIDASATMLARAVEEERRAGGREVPGRTGTGRADVAYVRGDAVRLPFRDGSFDAVSCFGALYLFADPWTALDGMARVLRPGGRIVILASRRLPTPLIGLASEVVGRLSGIRVFGPAEITGALSARGFIEVQQRSYGLMQFVSATLA